MQPILSNQRVSVNFLGAGLADGESLRGQALQVDAVRALTNAAEALDAQCRWLE
jgi:hypothetical protein